jgi:hypothetical protein
MSGSLVSVLDETISLEGVKLHLLLKETDRVVIEIKDIHNAIRNDADRHDAAVAEMRRLVSELRSLNAEIRQQYTELLRSANALLHSIAEKNLADSISKAVVDNVYIEVTPLLTSAIAEIAAKVALNLGEASNQSATQLLQIVQSVADAVAGKAPLPPPPDAGASRLSKFSRRLRRGLIRMQRFCITAAPILGTVAAALVVVASAFLITHFTVHGLK